MSKKKKPTKDIIEHRKGLIAALEIDDTRDNPSQDILHRRKVNRKNREKQLKNIENKYQFDDKEKENNISKNNTKNFSFISKNNNQLKRKFIQLSYYKKKLDNINNHAIVNKINPTKNNIQEIYHSIETDKLNGYDMYNMIVALQYQLRQEKENKIACRQGEIIKAFNQHGGIKLYLDLKNYLTDLGVNLDELHREKL